MTAAVKEEDKKEDTDEVAALETLEKEASEFNKVRPSGTPSSTPSS